MKPEDSGAEFPHTIRIAERGDVLLQPPSMRTVQTVFNNVMNSVPIFDARYFKVLRLINRAVGGFHSINLSYAINCVGDMR